MSLEATDERGMTALHYVTIDSEIGRRDRDDVIAQLLIDAGGDVNPHQNNGDTPLIAAVKNNRNEIIKLLLENEADPNITTAYGITALMSSVFAMNSEATKMLVEAGGDVNQRSSQGWTALHVLAFIESELLASNEAEIARILVSSGANPNLGDLNGMTPLMHAVREGNIGAFLALYSVGAEIGIKDQKGWTALHHCVATESAEGKNDNNLLLAQMLLNRGANINGSTDDLSTPLMVAAAGGHVEAVKFLLEAGAKVDLLNRFGENVIEVARQNEQYRVIAIVRDFFLDREEK